MTIVDAFSRSLYHLNYGQSKIIDKTTFSKSSRKKNQTKIYGKIKLLSCSPLFHTRVASAIRIVPLVFHPNLSYIYTENQIITPQITSTLVRLWRTASPISFYSYSTIIFSRLSRYYSSPLDTSKPSQIYFLSFFR